MFIPFHLYKGSSQMIDDDNKVTLALILISVRSECTFHHHLGFYHEIHNYPTKKRSVQKK